MDSSYLNYLVWKHRPRPKSSGRQHRALALIKDGVWPPDVAHFVGVDMARLRQWMRAAGLRPVEASPEPHPLGPDAVRLARLGTPVSDISAKLHLSTDTVIYFAAQAGVVPTVLSPYAQMVHAQKERVLALHGQGQDIAAIVVQLHVPETRIRRWLKEAGIQLPGDRPRGTTPEARLSPRAQLVLGALAGGERPGDIARTLGISRSTVSYVRKRWGFLTEGL